MIRQFKLILLAMLGSIVAIPAVAHPKLNLPISRQNSDRLEIYRAWASLHEDRVKVYGWVKREHINYASVGGKLRIEAWDGQHCVLVRHARWTQMGRRHRFRHFAIIIPNAENVSEIRISHVDPKGPDVCLMAGS